MQKDFDIRYKGCKSHLLDDRGHFPYKKMLGRCSSMEHDIRNKIIIILSYLLIWALAMIVFWFFTSGSDAMSYSLMYLWIILPATTFVESMLIGKNDF